MALIPSRVAAAALMGLLAPALAGAAPRVTAIRHWSAPDHTRVVLDLAAPAPYSVRAVAGPHRIVIDIPQGRFGCATGPRAVGDSLIQRVRCNALGRGAQVVLDLAGEFRYRAFALAAIPGQKPARLVVDVFPDPRPAGPAKPAAPAPAPSPFSRPVVVVIDPGHGGEDPGAILRGLREKNLTLDIARRMKSRLDAMPGYRAVLTRDGDYTVDLARRRRLAEEAGGDVLVSIHCNSAPSRRAGGAEIFYLSTKGASSRRAQALADLENRADQVGGIYPAADGPGAELVLDERLKEVLRRSHKLASTLHRRAKQTPELHSRGVKRAGFAVCKTLTMPSALVEVGFLSNAADFERLRSPRGRDRIADWLAGAVDAFFRGQPGMLDDPLFSAEPMMVYTVKRGDSVSKIAARHGVPTADVIRLNKLKRADSIRVGQKLILAAAAAPPPEAAAALRTYEVRRGDSLSAIAARYGLSARQLAADNGLRRPDRLLIGQKLVIRPEAASGRKG